MSATLIVTLVVAIVGAVCGILGAVLGVINTWHQLSKDRVKLRVVPKFAWMAGPDKTLTADRPAKDPANPRRSGPEP
jgi:hypothetical protein